MDGSQDFAASRLSFEVAGEGVAVDPATGRLSIGTDRLADGLAVVVTATNAAGATVSRLRLTLASEVVSAPVLVTAPALAPAATAGVPVGVPVVLDPGTWGGVPAPELVIAWLLDGGPVEGATGPSYTPALADAGRSLAARVTATNAAGSAAAETAACPVVHAAPTAVAALADVAADSGAAPVAVAAAAAFAGEALTFAVSGTGATIDSATGLVTIATDQLLDGERITVTATNSGGSAEASFSATVRATLPACERQPALAGASGGKAVVGSALTLDPGTWSGAPAPALAIAWLRDGAVVAGATGPSYAPAAADAGKSLAARVTATNAAGAAAAETAALAVVHAAPRAVAALADLALFVGDAAAVVEAAASFAGDALVFSVAGGGATVDARGRVRVPAATAGSATVTVTAANSGGSATVSFGATVAVRTIPPVLVLAPALAGSGRIGTPVTVSGGSWSGVPAPTTSVAWLRDGVAIAGATGTSYTPGAADDSKSLAARVTATNAGGSAETVTAGLAVTYAPPVAKGGLFDEVFDLGSGIQTVAAAADFTGEALVFAVTGAQATIDARTGVVSIPTDGAVQATVTVTATNSGGSASSRFQVTVEAEDVPFALEADDVEIVTSVWRPDTQETWLTPVVRFPGLAGETVHAIEWTTSARNPVPDAEFEVVARVGADHQLYMRDAAKNAPGASPRVDYSVFRVDETGRREALRFRWRRTAEGSWSALSPAFTVPAVPARWPAHQRFVLRSEAQEAVGEVGGTCMQFPRCADAEGDYVHMAYDVTWPSESVNFGDDWTSDACDGLLMSQTCSGICIDGKYVHGMFGALFMQNANASYDTKAGLYRKDRSTGKWTFRKNLPQVYGSNAAPQRLNLRYIAKVAGSGSGPETRTLFAIHAPAQAGSGSAGFSTIQIHKSTNGGDSWATDGGTLAVSTYGIPVELWADSTALYMNTLTGVWRRPIGGTAWTRATGLESGNVLHLEKHGSMVYACVKGKGLFTAADATTLAFTRLYAFDILTFGVCPTNTQKIIVVGSGASPKRTTNGGSSWSDVVSERYLGQPNNFAHKLAGPPAWVKWHATDPNVVLAMRFQHPGKSTDGGATFVWSSRNCDYSEIRSIAYHRTDYQRIFLGMTDRLLLASDHGAAFVIDDVVDSVKASIESALETNLSSFTASGTLLLDRGSQTGYVAQVGKNVGAKTPVISSRGVTTSETDKPTTGNGTISVTASPDLPAGTYTLTCTSPGASGATFTGVGPLGVSLGTWTAGTQRTYTHPRGGTLTVRITGGSTGFAAGSTPKVFTIFVNPIASVQVLNPETKNVSQFGQANPAVGYRGISGRHVFEMATDGSVSLVRTIAYPFQGYMGRGGSVILATNGSGTLMRSADEGVSWSTFASGLGNFSGLGFPIVTASAHDDQRAYVGTSDGRVKRIQNGTVTTVFSFDRWCTDNGISGDWPGNATVNGRLVPPVSGVAESHYDPNLLYCCVYLFGAPYQMFRTETALAASPIWECITSPDGLSGPLQGMSIHPLTDEPITFSSHGTVWYKPKAGHLSAYSITRSVIDDLRVRRGGTYWQAART